MALFRQIYTSFWTDPKVQEEFSVEDKMFFVYLISNPHTTAIGIYQITKKQIAFEIGWTLEVANAVMDRFLNHHKNIKYNTQTREIAIKNWGKYNLTKGGKPVIDCIKKELKEVKDKELIKYVSEHIEKEDIKNIYDAYYDTCDDTSTIHERHEEKKEVDLDAENQKLLENEHLDDTSTMRERYVQRYVDNNNNNNNNNKDNNKDNNNNKEKITVVVVDKIKEFFILEENEIKKVANAFLATGKEVDYLIEKLEIAKSSSCVNNPVAFLISALKNDYKPSIDKNVNSIQKKTGFHNFEESFTQYTPDELDEIIKKSQKQKFGS